MSQKDATPGVGARRDMRGPEKAPKGILHPNQSGVNYWEWYIAS